MLRAAAWRKPRFGQSMNSRVTSGRKLPTPVGIIFSRTCRQVDTGSRRSWLGLEKTRGAGWVALSSTLPTGRYRIEAELAGVRKDTRRGIPLNVNQNVRVDLR